MPKIEIIEVREKQHLREFIYFPEKLHRHHANWVPPIYADEWQYFNPKKNRAFTYSSARMFLAYRGKDVCGRIMGIINHRYNNLRRENNARFGYLECVNDQEVAHQLLRTVELWAKSQGMSRIVGPMGFTDQDPEGFLIEGFEHPPTLATYYNFEYIIQLVENEGYTKEIDYVVYKIDLNEPPPSFYQKIYQRVLLKKEFTLIEFTRKKAIKPFIRPIFYLMNDCFRDIYNYLPLDESDIDELSQRFYPLVDPRFIKIIMKDKDVVAFIIGIPNMAQGIRKAKGRLYPFGIFKILLSRRKSKQLDLLLGGIKEKYRGLGLDVLLGMRMMEEARQAGFQIIDSHHELETNLKMRAEMEKLGGKIYKRFRIYKKDLMAI